VGGSGHPQGKNKDSICTSKQQKGEVYKTNLPNDGNPLSHEVLPASEPNNQ